MVFIIHNNSSSLHWPTSDLGFFFSILIFLAYKGMDRKKKKIEKEKKITMHKSGQIRLTLVTS